MHLEQEIIELSYAVSFSDEQLKAHSAKIADLILRICTSIESVSKEICKNNQKHNDSHKFDYDCINNLQIEKKRLLLIIPNHMFKKPENMIYFPFTKESIGSKTNYSWTFAFNNLKHDLIGSANESATIRYLLESMAALTVLIDKYDASSVSSIFAEIAEKCNEEYCYLQPVTSACDVNVDQSIKEYLDSLTDNQT